MSASSSESPSPAAVSAQTQARARLSEGTSEEHLVAVAARLLRERRGSASRVADVGCGAGRLAAALEGWAGHYLGCDAVRYPQFPDLPFAEFLPMDLDRGIAIPSGSIDVVCSLEVIEHLENPRAFMRELVRILAPGGLLLVSTPNQLSLLSKATLLVKDQFNAFQEGSYPAHLTALLESDLRRIAGELRLEGVEIVYSDRGRMPLTARTWPAPLRGRRFSDNVFLLGRRP